MVFRMTRYAVAAMQRHLDAGHKKLPLVIPVLFYVGKRSPYPYSTRWLDEFDNPELAGKVYGGAYPLVDVTVIPDDEIMGHRNMAALTLLQKHIHQRDIATLTDQLATLLMADYLSSPQVIALIHYLLQAGESADSEAFVSELAQRVPQHGDALMPLAQLPEQKCVPGNDAYLAWQMNEIQCDTWGVTHNPCVMIFSHFKCFTCMNQIFISIAVTNHHFA